MKYEAVDLFCGVGGLTHGIQQSGIDVVAGIDIDETCEFAYTENNKSIFIGKSIEDVDSDEITNLYSENSIKILVGCAPCQPFSRYSYRYNKDGYKDDKWKLLYEYLRLIMEVKPDIISMENVPILAKTKVFQDFLNALEKNHYSVYWNIINCADYGVPQSRKRLVLLASKFNTISMIEPTHDSSQYETVRSAIYHLEKLNHGDKSENDNMHLASKLNAINQKRIKQSVAGGTWEDWTSDLLLDCHKKKSGKTYRSVYGRMEWDKPSPTITTQFYGYGNGRFGHPEQDRAISLREGAILQSFPLGYKFINSDDKLSNSELGKHIGNAVPVKLGEAIGKSILEHLRKEGK